MNKPLPPRGAQTPLPITAPRASQEVLGPKLRPRLGNPRLGRETKAEKEKRMRTWRRLNKLMMQEWPEHSGSVADVLGGGFKIPNSGVHRPSKGVNEILDHLTNPSYWR